MLWDVKKEKLWHSNNTSTYELSDQSVKNYTNTSNESATENMTVSFTKVRTSEKESISVIRFYFTTLFYT